MVVLTSTTALVAVPHALLRLCCVRPAAPSERVVVASRWRHASMCVRVLVCVEAYAKHACAVVWSAAAPPRRHDVKWHAFNICEKNTLKSVNKKLLRSLYKRKIEFTLASLTPRCGRRDAVAHGTRRNAARVLVQRPGCETTLKNSMSCNTTCYTRDT
eukprot:346020-Pleurochrysis_carterae.AAC.1